MSVEPVRFVVAWLLAGSLLFSAVAWSEGAPKKIVLIGGAKSEGSARHDYPNGIRLLKAFLETSPDAQRIEGLSIDAYPDGWPDDPAALQGASTIVCYFDGVENHPLLHPAHRARFEAAMQQGVGLVALHQASTVPADDTVIDLPRWLGGARYGMFDRTDEMVELKPAARAHPVSRGVSAFTYFDEFYPTFRFNQGRDGITPILAGQLHVQYRNGKPIVIGKPMRSTVAWTFQRDGGGRSFGFSGAHYLVALDEPAVRTLLLNAIFWTAGIDVPSEGVRSGMPDAATKIARTGMGGAAPVRPASMDTAAVIKPSPLDTPTFHRDPQRTGWNAAETALTPASVAGSSFGHAWASPQFDAIDGAPPRLYASPLYLDQVKMAAGKYAGSAFSVVFAASSNGFVYAVNAFEAGDVPAGTILWRTQLGAPCKLEPVPLDGVATGVLSTPVIDVARQRIYVTSCEREKRWQAHALDIASGNLLPGWPVRLDDAALNAAGVNRNAGSGAAGPVRRFDYRVQRGALNLSPDGSLLYVTFGESPTGWIVALDTTTARVASAFATLAEPHRGGGGIWGAGGPAVDAQGNVYVVSGTNYAAAVDQPHDWVQSVLKLSLSGPEGFVLRGTYTPFNYCATAKMDIDLGSGGLTLLPDLDSATTSTPHLTVVGGKQGNVYLLDRAHMPGRLDRRQPCSTDASSDLSLLPPEKQSQFGGRGPLNVFGPYTETDASMNMARSRSVPAYFRDSQGASYVFITGSTKAPGSPDSVPPSLVRIEVVAAPGKPAYLRVDQLEQTLVFANPGSAVVTSNGSRDAIVWVLDTNAQRTALLAGADAPQPVLYAFDALTFKLLWKSQPGELHPGGKYSEPVFARGTAFVGTDRIQAFSLRAAESAQTAQARPDGKTLYVQRCAICHDQPEGRIPPRELIASRPHRYLVDVLKHGAMRAQATGLTQQEIDALARYLTQPDPTAP